MMHAAIQKLTGQISEVCPIHGVSIGATDDKSTWRVDFIDSPTPEQETAVAAVIDAFDWATEAAD